MITHGIPSIRSSLVCDMVGGVPPPGGLGTAFLGTRAPIESVHPHMVRRDLLRKDLSTTRMDRESAHASEP